MRLKKNDKEKEQEQRMTKTLDAPKYHKKGKNANLLVSLRFRL